MKKKLAVALLASIPLTGVARSAAPSTAPSQQAVVADNAFATDLYAQLRQNKGNICVSPYSLACALSMVLAGAEGNTATQMLGVLHWTQPRADLPAAVAALSADILAKNPVVPKNPKDNRDAQIEIASALFGQKGYPYRQDFLDLLSDQYSASLQPVDYINHSGDALIQINKWAAEKTHGKIKDALPATAVTPLTRLVLVNAVYFKGQWLSEFSRQATVDQPFHGEADKSTSTPLMQCQASFGYMENDQLQAVELQYYGDFSMVVLLPRRMDGLPALEQSLSPKLIATIADALSNNSVAVALPKFHLSASYDLNETLSKLGMPDAFTTNSDFSGMASNEKLRIDKVQQKTFIAVDEQGTEAAAVTSVTARAMAMPSMRKVFTFRADHPFLFILKHRSSGAILFIGRYEMPE
jgi:serine protease inhibitor